MQDEVQNLGHDAAQESNNDPVAATTKGSKEFSQDLPGGEPRDASILTDRGGSAFLALVEGSLAASLRTYYG